MAFSKANLAPLSDAVVVAGAVVRMFVYSEVGATADAVKAAGYFNTVGQEAGVGDGTLTKNSVILLLTSEGNILATVTNDGTNTNDVTIADLTTLAATNGA